MTDIKSLNLPELLVEMEAMGEKKFRAGQLYEWMHVRLARGFEEMSNLPKDMRQRLQEKYEFTALKIVRVQESKIDGTRK